MLLALVAFVSFSSAIVADPGMINVIDMLSDFGKFDDKTIDRLLDNNKLSQADRKDAKMAQLVKLLEKISKVNWEAVDKYIQVNKISPDRTLSVDGKKVEMPKMFKLLESVSKIHWVAIVALFCNSKLSSYFLIVHQFIFALISISFQRAFLLNPEHLQHHQKLMASM